MSYLALHGQSYPSDFTERHAWTAQDNRELAAFIAQVTCIVVAAVILYALGPALGLLLVAGCLAVWALLRRSGGAPMTTPAPPTRKKSPTARLPQKLQ